MTVLESIKSKAAKLNRTIILCEGEDPRVVKAAQDATAEGVCKIVLLGNEEEIKAKNPDVDLTGVTIIDPQTSEKTGEYAALLYELRKSKGMTEEEAKKLAKDNTYFGVLMLKAGGADGLVSGACHSTANTLRPGLQIVKTAKSAKMVSSCFIMIAPEGGNQYVPDGLVVFGDCGLCIDPTAEELSEIAIMTANSAATLTGIDPKVAMLSFSTKGSGKHATVDKVKEALALVHEKAPELKVDGELQFDAAVVPSVASLKAPGSTVAGHANVFIFPDINAGNIAYKIAERFGGFMAIGPICQGFAKPIIDLSRGCKTEDIVAACAITALQTVGIN